MKTTLNYHKRRASVKEYVSPFHVTQRVQFAHEQLIIRSEPEDWKNVRFSDEHHEEFNLIKQRWIIRKSENARRIVHDNIQHQDSQSTQKNKQRLHIWACVNWNFKLKLFFYVISININDKMTLKKYVNIFHRPDGVEEWLINDENFILEKDRDASHDTDAHNIARSWKKTHGLKYYFNAPVSSDLSVIENCFQPLKSVMKNKVIYDDEILKEELINAWEENVKQDFINKQILSMSQRLHDVIKAEGAMTGY